VGAAARAKSGVYLAVTHVLLASEALMPPSVMSVRQITAVPR
jgi:hypothetical protein